MQKSRIHRYFVFGYNYHLLRRNGLDGVILEDGKRALLEFLEYLDELDLQVTKGIAANLIKIVEELKNSDESHITATQTKKIKETLEKLDPTLDSELSLRYAYILTKKRYPLESLLSTPSELLSKNSVNTLAITTKKDFSAACKSIAFSQPTSAAFHLMRALEAQVKVLYFAFKKTKRLEKPMWGPMTTQLRDKRAPKPSAKLLAHLDSMRVHFRNPTQHPDAFYTMDEAQDLLNQTIAAINMIAAELPKKDLKEDAADS